MKKIRNFPRYRKYQERRKERSLREVGRRSRSSRRSYSVARERRETLARGLGFITLPMPHEFSLVHNPDEMIRSISILRDIIYQRKQSVVLDLSEVRNVTNDAIILILSVVQDRRVPNWVKVWVKSPINEEAAKRLRESGIDEHYEVQDVAIPKSGRIRVKRSYEANSEMANELIQHATRTLFGKRRPLKKVQRILSECIANTNEHAGGNPDQKKEKMWWGTVFCESKKNIAYFSLLDNGIGIVESLRSEWFSRIPMLAKYRTNISLMKAVFDGKILSSTNETNRGNGLPAIFKARAKKEFTGLVLITNNVYIDFDKDLYRQLETSFSGTFFHWEVNGEQNASS